MTFHTCLQESSMSPSHTQMNYSSKARFSVIHMGGVTQLNSEVGNLNPKAQVTIYEHIDPILKPVLLQQELKQCLQHGFITQFSLVAQSYATLRPHGLQHARLPCPSPSPRTCSTSCPLSQGCYATISPSVAPSPPARNLSQHQVLFQ